MQSIVPHTCTWKIWMTSHVGYLKLLISRSILSGPLDLLSKRVQKMNFQGVCYKNCRMAFRLVLQCTTNLLGSRKSGKIYFHKHLVFALTIFLFWPCILVWIIYTWLTKSVFTAYIAVIIGSYMWTLPDHPGASRKCGPTPALPGVRQNLLDVKIQKKKNFFFFFTDIHLCAYVW